MDNVSVLPLQRVSEFPCDFNIGPNLKWLVRHTRRSVEVCARTPAVIGLLCASASLQRTLCAAGLAEGVRLRSNDL
jgi:hypothetical protein